jgi:hypothetical protein
MSRVAVVALAIVSMAHVGSPDTFFGGKAGPYDVRVSVRLPGVIPGRAQVTVRVSDPGHVTSPGSHHVTVRAGQWNVGLNGAPPAETLAPVPGDPSLFASELWFMTAQPYELAVAVDGPQGRGDAVVPVMALATAERPMPPWLGSVLAALGIFLTLGLLTIVGTAVRESGLPPGAQPDAPRRRRGRIAVVIAGIVAALALWGGDVWWNAEASAYGRFIVYRPFDATASLAGRTLTLDIRDPRWTGAPIPQSMYNALTPDHGKLMHLFLVRDDENAMAHVHPVARTRAALAFDVNVPPLPPGHYRVYADIVHESGYAQTLVSSVDLGEQTQREAAAERTPTDPDDSWFAGTNAPEIVWERGVDPIVAGKDRDLRFFVRDASGAELTVEPYMGMAAHVLIASRDGSVFAHLHPAGSIAMAALQRFSGGAASPHAGHDMPMEGHVAIPYAFPKPGAYRVFVQIKREGTVRTAAFDVDVRQR